MNDVDLNGYPDSGKILATNRAPGGRPKAGTKFFSFHERDAVDYLDDEPNPAEPSDVKIERIGVAGAGTMGAGIAQLACLGRFETFLHDPDADALERGAERLRAALLKGADRGRWTPRGGRGGVLARLLAATRLDDLGGCDLVIEAAPESLELKRDALRGARRGLRAGGRSSPRTPPRCR